MKIINIILASALLLSVSSCRLFKGKEKKMDAPAVEAIADESKYSKECPEDKICTMDYRTIGVEMISTNKQTVIDDARLLFVDANQHKIKMCKINEFDGRKSIILATDSDMKMFKKDGDRVKLQLRSQGQMIVEQDYVIGHDCCHIKLIKGQEVVKF